MSLSAQVEDELTNESQVAPPNFCVLGVDFCAVQISDVIQTMRDWISDRSRSRYICASNVHSTIESRFNTAMRRALSGSDLNVPDGMPIVWLGRLQGHDLPRRVYGPELFEQFLRETQHCGYRHFFYGGSQPTLDALEKSLKASFSRIQIAGCYSPPFRTLTAEEESDAIEMITRASPDVLWVGLGCPKQELWMCEQSMRLRVPVMVGVGQAFNIYAGQLRQAPRWMRESGLEWLFRLCLEPRRLWKRYVVYNSLFLYYLTLERLGFKSFDR